MKNKFLLLSGVATIAVASTAFAVNYEQATIGAEVAFASPAVATQGDDIYFGVLDPAAGGTLTVNPNGTFDGTAKVIKNGGGGTDTPIRSGSIKFSGGRLVSAASDSYTLVDAETKTYTQNLSGHDPDGNDFLVKLALDGAKINMYKGHYSNQDHSSGASCGYVDNLTQGNASWDGTYYTLRIGGTLNLNFDNTYGDATDTTCSGKTTVTYVLQEWF